MLSRALLQLGVAQKGLFVAMQLARLREGAEESRRREEAAKAVLSAARAAQREGRVLSREDISAVEGPILSPATAASAAPPQTVRLLLVQQLHRSAPASVMLPKHLRARGIPFNVQVQSLGFSGQCHIGDLPMFCFDAGSKRSQGRSKQGGQGSG